MIVKPSQQEAESRLAGLARSGLARGRAVKTGARTAAASSGRAVRKMALWYLVGVFGFGLLATLLTHGGRGIVVAAILAAVIWWIRKRQAS